MKKLLVAGVVASLLCTYSQVLAKGSNSVPSQNADIHLISPTHYKGYSSYEQSFSIVPDNGHNANLFVKNKSGGKIYMKIYEDGKEQFDVQFDDGEQKTTTIYTKATLNFKIYIYTRDGHQINCDVSARQYE